jgi:hypothetical protein
VQSINLFLPPGNNIIPLQLQTLAAGVYAISVTGTGNKVNSIRFIKSK